MNKDLVIYDGSNFYHGAKHLSPRTHLTDFNYRGFAEEIAGNKNIEVEYCVGEIVQRTHQKEKSRKLYANQQALFYNLEKQKIAVKKGFMLYSSLSYHEKGVDVRIALDIAIGALKNNYRKCYIISSDTDILPAVLEAKAEGKKVVYVGFDKSISRMMEARCSEMICIKKEMIKKFSSK